MITVTSKPNYTSKDHKLIVFETTVKIEVEDNATLMAELDSVLKSIILSDQISMRESEEIARILEEAADTLAERVKAIMGGEEHDIN